MTSEVDTLRTVLLAWPPETLAACSPPADYLLRAAVDLSRMRRQTLAIAEAYRASGVTVHLDTSAAPRPPNYVFMRDLLFMTPAGAVLGRMASSQRAGEERHAAAALASLGIPILASADGEQLFEGADALWLGSREVIVGVGNRTNRAGYDLLATVLARFGVTTHAVPAPNTAQHLLGCVNFIDTDLAAVLTGVAPTELIRLLLARGIRDIQVPVDEESRDRRAMNFVALSPRRVLMPANCKCTRELFESYGVHCSEVDISEYANADGGLGCLTGVLWRMP